MGTRLPDVALHTWDLMPEPSHEVTVNATVAPLVLVGNTLMGLGHVMVGFEVSVMDMRVVQESVNPELSVAVQVAGV
jgi:hypothetical protein